MFTKVASGSSDRVQTLNKIREMNKQKNGCVGHFPMIYGLRGFLDARLAGCPCAFLASVALMKHACSTLYISKNTEDGRDDPPLRMLGRDVWKALIL